MSIQIILIAGAIILACGCAGLLMVRFDNPRLLGLGWLGTALATGGTGALLLLIDGRQSPLCSVFLSDLLVLASLVFLHFAVMEVVGVRGVPLFALSLLTLQAAADLFKIYNPASPRFRIAVVGVLIAAQAAHTVLLLLRRAVPTTRSPARFIVGVLSGFIIWNLLRSFATASGLLASHSLSSQVQVITYVLYLAVALGLAFGFFWMTTSGLTAQLDDLASTDPLTGVHNRRSFDRCLHNEFNRTERFADSFALLMLDLDHFKQVNDRYGHVAGDKVLCAAVENILDATRGIDIVGRWGGEEFAILLPHASIAAAQIVAERIRTNIQRVAPSSDKLKHIPITASLGLAVRRPEDSLEEIVCRADAALYRAKSVGRNCVVGDMTATSHNEPKACFEPFNLPQEILLR